MLLAYLAAAAVAVLVWIHQPHLDPWLRGTVAWFAATLVLWLVGAVRNNPSVFDPFWSLAPLPLIAAWAFAEPTSALPARQWLVCGLVGLWGARLTYHWWRTWPGLHHEDWRYTEIRGATGRWFPIANLVVIHLAPACMLGLICLTTYPAVVFGAEPLGWLDVVATVWALAALAFESSADATMRRFRARTRTPGQVCEDGWWAWARHPNYFGEVMFWWGLYLLSVASVVKGDPSVDWAVAGPVVLTVLMILYSGPALDRRMAQRSPNYVEYMRRVPAILPRRPQ